MRRAQETADGDQRGARPAARDRRRAVRGPPVRRVLRRPAARGRARARSPGCRPRRATRRRRAPSPSTTSSGGCVRVRERLEARRAPSASSRSATTASCTSCSALTMFGDDFGPEHVLAALPPRPRQHRHLDLHPPRAARARRHPVPRWALTTWNDRAHLLARARTGRRRCAPRPSWPTGRTPPASAPRQRTRRGRRGRIRRPRLVTHQRTGPRMDALYRSPRMPSWRCPAVWRRRRDGKARGMTSIPLPPIPLEPGGTRRPRPRPRRPARRQPLRPPRAAPLGHRDLRPGGARQGRQRRLEALRHGQLAVAAGRRHRLGRRARRRGARPPPLARGAPAGPGQGRARRPRGRDRRRDRGGGRPLRPLGAERRRAAARRRPRRGQRLTRVGAAASAASTRSAPPASSPRSPS